MAVFRIMLRMQIRPGMGAEFEKAWYSIGDVVSGHPANLGQWLLRSGDEENLYYIMSDWVGEPEFREFEQSPQHLEHRQKLHPYREQGSMATMHVVYDMAKLRSGAR
jgi:heme-degrading monooxygenase HmoA